MARTEVIVDTCFLHKLSSDGKAAGNIKKVLDQLNYTPVVHPYMYKQELCLHSYLMNLVKEGYIRVIPYSEFLQDADDCQLYETYYNLIYEDMRVALEAAGGSKRIEGLRLYNGQTIYNTHRQGSSMGDVHMILMAVYLQLPVVLTEDSDIDLLCDIAKRRMQLGHYSLQIINAVELIEEIARRSETTMTSKEIETILKAIGERPAVSRIKALWRENHSI